MPQLAKMELDRAFSLASKGKTPVEIHEKLETSRKRRGQTGPDLTTVRRALRGRTHNRGAMESRGRKTKLTDAQLRRINAKRKELIRKAKKEKEVHLEDVMAAAGASHVSESLVSKRLKEKYDVSWRQPRAEPLRDGADEEERVRIGAFLS